MHVYDVVISSGQETKVMQNATGPLSKRSSIERKMDSIVYFLFIVLVLLALVGAIVFGIRTKLDMPDWWYMRPDDTTDIFDLRKSFLSGFYQFITALMLYADLIPIALYITLEIVKVRQLRFINNDIHMCHEETNEPAHARTSNLNEELGQVDTILSDKTGTLTCNQMDFLKCSIADVSYGVEITEVKRATAKRMNKNIEELEFRNNQNGTRIANGEVIQTVERHRVKGFSFNDARLMDGNWASGANAGVIQMFFRILAVC